MFKTSSASIASIAGSASIASICLSITLSPSGSASLFNSEHILFKGEQGSQIEGFSKDVVMYFFFFFCGEAAGDPQVFVCSLSL